MAFGSGGGGSPISEGTGERQNQKQSSETLSRDTANVPLSPGTVPRQWDVTGLRAGWGVYRVTWKSLVSFAGLVLLTLYQCWN